MGRFLTHYTSDINAVGEILTNGFAWVPNKRNLISSFLPEHDFYEREPQEFGMISFTELKSNEASALRDTFGSFGIKVSESWAIINKAQKVLYLDDDGPLFDAIKNIFQIGYHDLKSRIKYPEDAAWNMSYTNKAMASSVAGAGLWASLLQLYEYMEPIRNSYQHEWRIVHQLPLYGYKDTKSEVIENISPPKNWSKFIHVLKVFPSDITGLVCPEGKESEFREYLPNEYKSHDIETYKA